MNYTIPTSLIESNFPQTGPLDGVQYLFDFRWNARAGRTGRWFLSLSDTDGNKLITGRKLCSNAVWGQRDNIEGRPPGRIWVIATTVDSDEDPGLRELGARVRLTYADEASSI